MDNDNTNILTSTALTLEEVELYLDITNKVIGHIFTTNILTDLPEKERVYLTELYESKRFYEKTISELHGKTHLTH